LLDFLSKRLYALLDTLVEPLWRRVLALAWPARLGILLGASLALLAAGDPEATRVHVERVACLARVALSDPSAGVPFSADLLGRVRETAQRIEATLVPELVLAGGYGKEPWPMAQTIAAATEIPPAESQAVLSYFDSAIDPACGCWSQIPGPSHPDNVVVSGWIALAQAKLGHSLDPRTLRFFLDEQHEDGWWSLFPVHGEESYASVYGTAWALLGLQAQLDADLVKPAERVAVTASLARASAWLRSTRERDRARWKPYPNNTESTVFLSTSGVALHALHRGQPEGNAALDALWLDDLPDPPPPVQQVEVAAVWLNARQGRFEDTLAQLQFPWLVIATIDAYSSGTSLQRARALAWLERALSSASLRNADTQLPNWYRAELLLALHHALGSATTAPVQKLAAASIDAP
jgi:hypothetical protein